MLGRLESIAAYQRCIQHWLTVAIAQLQSQLENWAQASDCSIEAQCCWRCCGSGWGSLQHQQQLTCLNVCNGAVPQTVCSLTSLALLCVCVKHSLQLDITYACIDLYHADSPVWSHSFFHASETRVSQSVSGWVWQQLRWCPQAHLIWVSLQHFTTMTKAPSYMPPEQTRLDARNTWHIGPPWGSHHTNVIRVLPCTFWTLSVMNILIVDWKHLVGGRLHHTMCIEAAPQHQSPVMPIRSNITGDSSTRQWAWLNNNMTILNSKM